MSGHSHWSTIKRQKEAADIKRGQIFSKLSRALSIAAREGGDPKTNPKLRLATDQAKKFNMPKGNIERAIKRGLGELEGEELEKIFFEVYGPGGIAIIVEGITDNKNRSLSEISQILRQHNAKLASEGSVRWLFDRKGVISVTRDKQDENFQKKEVLELAVIEAGAEDTYWHDDILDVYVKIEDLEKVKENLEKKGITIETASLDWVAKKMIQIPEKEKEATERFFETLDENDAVQEIYSNLKL